MSREGHWRRCPARVRPDLVCANQDRTGALARIPDPGAILGHFLSDRPNLKGGTGTNGGGLEKLPTRSSFLIQARRRPSMADPRFIADALELPGQSLFYEVSGRLASLFPDQAILETSDCDFNLFTYVREGLCTIRVKEGVHPQVAVWWSADLGIQELPKNAWYEVDWRGHTLEVLVIDTPDAMTHHWIIGPNEVIARAFFKAVCSYDPDYAGEILVFEQGRFEASSGLFRGLSDARMEDLILAGGLKEQIRADVLRFFSGREAYHALGAPWKRGLLLTGPPGNGKTHTIKGLVAELGRPCLYIKSFKSERWTEETAIRRIFDRARTLAPCLLVLEDLDALVTDENRSFLLNELDGFSRNEGLMVIATTNHPDRLDPALVERPSRFDRRYDFPLPGAAERLAFLQLWHTRLPECRRPSETAMELAQEVTAGFSFAYLKELYVGMVLALASTDSEADEVFLDQVERLRLQLQGLQRR